MPAILLSGFLTGLLLQIAIGPVFFFILNLSLQKTLIDGWVAVVAVTIVDYIFIALAGAGVGKLLEKPKINIGLGISGSIILILFGVIMILTHEPNTLSPISDACFEPNPVTSFVSAFLLTLSSPLTIVFWTGLFAARAIEKGYTKNQLVCFGIAAGLATFVFLGTCVALLSIIRMTVPPMVLKIAHMAVGALLIVYGTVRLSRCAVTRN